MCCEILISRTPRSNPANPKPLWGKVLTLVLKLYPIVQQAFTRRTGYRKLSRFWQYPLPTQLGLLSAGAETKSRRGAITDTKSHGHTITYVRRDHSLLCCYR
jgi:hypothetical protein